MSAELVRAQARPVELGAEVEPEVEPERRRYWHTVTSAELARWVGEYVRRRLDH